MRLARRFATEALRDASGLWTCAKNEMVDIDIWFSARLLIDCHGAGAKLEAARRLSDFQAGGDHEGARTWARIHEAILLLTNLSDQGKWHASRTIN